MPPTNDFGEAMRAGLQKRDQRSYTNKLLVIWITQGHHFSKSELIGCSKKTQH